MRKKLGLLFILGAIACVVLAVLLKPQGWIQAAINSNWIAYPIGVMACLILAGFCLFRARRGFGVLVLVLAADCFLIAYLNGGPGRGNTFELSDAIRMGGIWALGGLALLFVAFPLLFGGKKPTAAPIEPPADARTTARPPART
jgi:hypothetical protein